MKGGRKLVWSSEKPVERKGPETVARRLSRPPAEHDVRVRRERSGRGGKEVTVASPLYLTQEGASRLLAAWKKLCGSGGALKPGQTPDGVPYFDLEVQGDHADRLVAELIKAGYKAKRSGG